MLWTGHCVNTGRYGSGRMAEERRRGPCGCNTERSLLRGRGFQYDVARGLVERQHPFPRRNPINMKPEGLFFSPESEKKRTIIDHDPSFRCESEII